MNPSAKEFILPPLQVGEVVINLFCDLETAKSFEFAVANCWAWAQMNQLHAYVPPFPISEDTLYSQAKFFYDAAVLKLSTAESRKGFLKEAMPIVARLQIPKEVQTQLAHKYSRELAYG